MEKRVREDTPRLHVLSIVLRDVPQALSRVVGLFSARGYNIEELTVCRAKSAVHGSEDGNGVSRVTIGTISDDHTCSHILAQVGRIVDVLEAVDLTDDESHAEARITLVKVGVSSRLKRSEVIIMATNGFRAVQIRTRPKYLTFRFSGRKEATRVFIETMETFGPVESASTGVTALA